MFTIIYFFMLAMAWILGLMTFFWTIKNAKAHWILAPIICTGAYFFLVGLTYVSAASYWVVSIFS